MGGGLSVSKEEYFYVRDSSVLDNQAINEF
jgi:hypothetical protein